eukprot:7383749-Pyramimonas_sp.AAC.2
MPPSVLPQAGRALRGAPASASNTPPDPPDRASTPTMPRRNMRINWKIVSTYEPTIMLTNSSA